MARSSPSLVGLGLRERNKIDKLRRIKEAASELFLSRGFDDATTREIASRAGVGIGTLFIYADDKRDLLFLVVNEELADITTKAEASVKDDISCLQNLLNVFRLHYEFFGRQPLLSRLMLAYHQASQCGQRNQLAPTSLGIIYARPKSNERLFGRTPPPS
jgi:AcrR family transcriptional regulator